jgi:hypothetical protein
LTNAWFAPAVTITSRPVIPFSCSSFATSASRSSGIPLPAPSRAHMTLPPTPPPRRRDAPGARAPAVAVAVELHVATRPGPRQLRELLHALHPTPSRSCPARAGLAAPWPGAAALPRAVRAERARRGRGGGVARDLTSSGGPQKGIPAARDVTSGVR